MTTFQEANEKIHRVEDHWSYKILTKYGFRPINKSEKGMVRTFDYINDNGDQISATTGASGDHWSDKTKGEFGYYGSLNHHLSKNY